MIKKVKIDEANQIQEVITKMNSIDLLLDNATLNKNQIQEIFQEISLYIEKWHKGTNIKPLLELNDIIEAKNVTKSILAMLDLKLRKTQKKAITNLGESSNLKSFAALTGLETPEFANKYLIESYQTFAGKCRFDKEILINGAIPYLFNKNLKTINLVNFFRTIKYSQDKNSEDLIIKKEKFNKSLRMGKILKKVNETGNDEQVIYFKNVLDDDSSYEIIEVNYDTKTYSVVSEKISFKKVHFKEVFGRIDVNYLTKVNILQLNFEDIIYDMVTELITEQRIKKLNEKIANKKGKIFSIPVSTNIIS